MRTVPMFAILTPLLLLLGGAMAPEAQSEPPFRPTAKYWRTGHLGRSALRNPAQTWWMLRYTERDATHYRRVYDYRALYDYPWSAPTPPPPPALRGYAHPIEIIPSEELPPGRLEPPQNPGH